MRGFIKTMRIALVVAVGGTALYGARAYRDDLALTYTLASFWGAESDCRNIELIRHDDGWITLDCTDHPPAPFPPGELPAEATATGLEGAAAEDADALAAGSQAAAEVLDAAASAVSLP